MSESIKAKKVAKSDNLFEIKMVVTAGKARALVNALQTYRQISPVADDLAFMLHQALLDGNGTLIFDK